MKYAFILARVVAGAEAQQAGGVVPESAGEAEGYDDEGLGGGLKDPMGE